MQLKSIESGDKNNINTTNLPTTNSAMEISESIKPESTQLKTYLAEQESENISNRSPIPRDDLEVNPKSPINAELDSDTETNYKSLSNKKLKSRLILDDSDEEETLQSEETAHNNEEGGEEVDATHKRIAVLDSDSDSEDSSSIAPHNKSFNKDENVPIVYTTNSQGDIVPEDQQPKKSALAKLCDSDSEAEDTREGTSPEFPDSNNQHSETKSKKPIIGDETFKPTTVKDAQEQRKLIQSESQRMLREKHISLPYHKPKTRSLQEFLARRPKLSKATADLVKAPPSVAIKMSMDQLEEISKKLEEREKEVKEFYKSESESDGGEEDDKDYVPPTENLAVTEENVNKPAEVIKAIEEAPLKASEDHVDLPESSEASKADSSTETYQFNLDDIESGVTKYSDTAKEPTSSKTFTYTDLDQEIEDFGKPTIKSKLELLREQLANDKPKLTGSPDDIIDLDEDSSRPREVEKLMERFAKHVQTHKKHQLQHKVKLSVVTVEPGGDILKEEVAMNVESDEEGPVVEEKPGAKLQKLKEELQRQMEQKKAELWQQKAAKGLGETTEEGETVEKDVLDDEDEEEMEWTDEEEEELEEDDVDLTDKPHKKSEFLDEEAEESEQDEAVADKEGYESGAEIESDTGSESAVEEQGKKRVLKRIVKPEDDDSEDDDLFGESVNLQPTSNLQLDSTVTADEDEIPSHQMPSARTPVKPQISQGKSINDFLTPISFITSIQNLNSASKGSVVSPFKMPSDLKSPIKSSTFSQNNLFSQSEASFSSISQPSLNPNTQDETPTTQDLLEICSGQFTGITQVEPPETSTQDESTLENTQSSELKALGNEDMVISQLLDEEELENFKKKFESPVPVRMTNQVRVEEEEVTGGGVIDSDEEGDEDDNDVTVKRKRKLKKHRKIQFSDDESSSDEENDEPDEVIDLQDMDDNDIDNVAYDSEENEIDLKAEAKKEQIKIADFVEAEAELSESEWGSADEDEKDLDQLEFEVGDEEKFDQEKMKADLEKIHMRRLLDDDTREVKLLQELLLEDGEMHGTGRQRQFKWKNIDLNEDDANADRKDEDDIYLDEEESEEQWRRRRHEREMFLKSQKEKDRDSQDLLDSSQLLKIGQKMLQRSISLTPSDKEQKPLDTSLFSLQNKRGSFLNRSDHVLQRVAEYTKVSAELCVDSSKKTTKHFLFQSVSMSESFQSKKRKAAEGTPNVLKKLRLSTNLSPAIKKKSERSKKLFDI